MKKLLGLLGLLVVAPVWGMQEQMHTPKDIDIITLKTVISNKPKTYELMVTPTTTIHDIKNHISKTRGIGIEYQHIHGIRMAYGEDYTVCYKDLDDLMPVKRVIDQCKTKQFELTYKF